MKKPTAVLYLLVILAGIAGGLFMPRSFYQGRAPLPAGRASTQETSGLLADRQ